MLTTEQQIFEQIKKAKNILITFNKLWNGDTVASALAFYLFLQKMDKNTIIAAEKFGQDKIYSFLPAYKKINTKLKNLHQFIISLDISETKIKKIKYKIKEKTLDFIITPKNGSFNSENVSVNNKNFIYDLIIILDTPDLESLGTIYDNETDFFYQTPIINIDHHANNEEFGQINKIELTAVATSEILFNLFSNYSKDMIDENIATCLLAGIISKTHSFKTQKITPQVLTTTSELMAMGGRREEIANQFYRSRSLGTLKLWGRTLARLTSDLNNTLIWSILNQADFTKTGGEEKNLKEVIDELIINIPQAKIIAIIYEYEKSTKALIFAMKNINAMDLIKNLNPKGTKNLAEITLSENLPQAEEKIIQNIKNSLKKLSI